MTRRSFRALVTRAGLGLALLVAMAVAWAADPGMPAGTEQPEPADRTEPERSEPTAQSTPSGERNAADTPSPEVFMPSEEISEDYNVAFPVDI
jgi:hypothetical protein